MERPDKRQQSTIHTMNKERLPLFKTGYFLVYEYSQATIMSYH